MFVRGMCIFTLWSFQNQCPLISTGDNYAEILLCSEEPPFDSFEYFLEEGLHVEENNTPKANLKCTCRITRLLNFDTVLMMSRNNIDCASLFTCKHNDPLLCLW